MELDEELLSLATAFARENVEYALVGGLAVAVWGAPRATQDIDLLIPPLELEKAKRCAREQGFLLENPPQRFRDGMVLHRSSKVVAEQLLMLDLILVDENTEAYWQKREKKSVDGRDLWVLSREALIAMKNAAGRPQDQADVLRLLEMDR